MRVFRSVAARVFLRVQPLSSGGTQLQPQPARPRASPVCPGPSLCLPPCRPGLLSRVLAKALPAVGVQMEEAGVLGSQVREQVRGVPALGWLGRREKRARKVASTRTGAGAWFVIPQNSRDSCLVCFPAFGWKGPNLQSLSRL